MKTLYLGHPVVNDKSGIGIARVIVERLDEFIPRNQMLRSFRGGCYDDGVINVNVSTTVEKFAHFLIKIHPTYSLSVHGK